MGIATRRKCKYERHISHILSKNLKINSFDNFCMLRFEASAGVTIFSFSFWVVTQRRFCLVRDQNDAG